MFKRLKTLMMIIIMASSSLADHANAAWLGAPAFFKKEVDKIMLTTPVLAPFAYSRFCARYSDECRVHGIYFRRPKPVILTGQRLHDIIEVNQAVNQTIIPTPYLKTNFYDSWSIAPKAGDCNDFAVTKRHELLARGWPSRALLLAEVVIPSGEHHLILVVRTKDRDFVLDNLTPMVRPWWATRYQWVKVQSPFHPTLWSNIAGASNA
jgi:predicted transglutaminase-like cysteine proteinase